MSDEANALSPAQVRAKQSALLTPKAKDLINKLLITKFQPDTGMAEVLVDDIRRDFSAANEKVPDMNHIILAYGIEGWAVTYQSPAHIGEDQYQRLFFRERKNT